MAFPLQRTTQPTNEPVFLADMKNHLRVDIADDDDLIAALIMAARERAEEFTGRALVTQGYTMAMDQFPFYCPVNSQHYMQYAGQGLTVMSPYYQAHHIIIPRPPLQTIESIKYTDMNGVQQTLDPNAYLVDTLSSPGRVQPPFGQIWPIALPQMNSVQIKFTAGYSDTNPLPSVFIAAIKLIVGALYENREDFVVGAGNAVELPLAAKYLLNSYRVSHFGVV